MRTTLIFSQRCQRFQTKPLKVLESVPKPPHLKPLTCVKLKHTIDITFFVVCLLFVTKQSVTKVSRLCSEPADSVSNRILPVSRRCHMLCLFVCYLSQANQCVTSKVSRNKMVDSVSNRILSLCRCHHSSHLSPTPQQLII